MHPLLALLTACTTAKGGSVAIDNAGRLTVEVETAPSYDSGSVEVRVIVRNPTEKSATFCTYHTPFEGVRNNIFVVKRGEEELRYRGMMAKRAPPTRKDHLKVGPGSSKQATVDLATAYDLTSGHYTVAYRGTGISGLNDSAPASFEVK